MAVQAGIVLIVMGKPNAGKDTVAARLAAMIGGVSISSGDVIRNSKTKADAAAQAQQATGALVDSSHFERIMEAAIREVPSERPIVLSGVTKKPGEVDWLMTLLNTLGRQLAQVIYLAVSDEVALARYATRIRSEHRNDDAPEIQQRRLDEFNENTLLSIERYRDFDLIVKIDASHDIETVIADIASQLGLKLLPVPTP